MLTGPALGAAIEAARLKKGVSKRALAAAFGVSPPSVQDWVNRGTIDKQKLPALWAFFQDVAGPEHWGLGSWPSFPPVNAGLSTLTVAQELSPPYLQTLQLPATQVPVIGTLEKGESTMFDLKAAPDGRPIGVVPAYGNHTPGTFAVRVFGDDLYPAVRHGACLIVAPAAPCQEGELVLLQLHGGPYLVCELVSLRAETVTVVPANGGARRTLMRADVATVHAITGVASGSTFVAAADA
jgi:SOS-response transcriptional repressor LexA